MRFCTIFLAALFYFYSGSCGAQTLTLLGGLNFSAPNASNSMGDFNAIGSGVASGGIVFSYEVLSHSFDLETGVLLLQSKYSLSQNDTSTIHVERDWQIPFIIRVKLDALIGLGLGAYYGVSNFPDAVPSARSTHDWGLLINLKGHIPIRYPWALAVDVRYQLGMSDQTPSPLDVYKTRNLQTLAGISYFF